MATNETDFRANVQIPEGAPSSFTRLYKWFLKRVWYLQSSSHIHVAIPPSQTYQILEMATKPSVNRLGLRKLFEKGRRYFIRSTQDGGFQMSTNSRVWWHPKRRTPITTILTADFETIDNNISRLKLQSRVKLRYLLGQLIYPTFFSSLLIYMDWSFWVIVMSILGLYGLSWVGHRFTALLEVHEIIFFMETVLADFAPEPPKQLAEEGADIVIEDDFVAEWDRFVEEKRGE